MNEIKSPTESEAKVFLDPHLSPTAQRAARGAPLAALEGASHLGLGVGTLQVNLPKWMRDWMKVVGVQVGETKLQELRGLVQQTVQIDSNYI